MTSQAYSPNNTGVPARANAQPRTHAARYAFRSAFGIGAILFNILVFLFVWLIPFINADVLADNVWHESILYWMMPLQSLTTFFIVLLIQAPITALCQFGFLFNKRASALYFSLPIRRASLFWARFAAGLIMLCVPHILSFSWLLYVNIAVLGWSVPLMQGYAIMLGGTIVTLFSIYSIVTVVCCRVGTAAEGIIFSALALFALPILPPFVTELFTMFLHGNALGEMYNFQPIDFDIGGSMAKYLPALNFNSFLNRYAIYVAEDGVFRVYFWNNDGQPGLWILCLWLVLSVGIGWLAAIAFKRYKAEHSGALGTNRVWNVIAIFLSAFLLFVTGCAALNANVLFKCGLGVLCALVGTGLCRFLLTLNLRKSFDRTARRTLYVALATVAVIAVVCLTGGFGYEKRLPDADEVAYARILYPGAPDFIPGNGSDFGNYNWGNRNDTDMDIVVRDYDDLTFSEPDDIRTMIGLHQALIDAGPRFFNRDKQTVNDAEKDRLSMRVYVQYRLKNGKRLCRLYTSVPASVARDFLSLDETKLIQERTRAATAYASEYGDTLPVYITDSLYGRTYAVAPEDHTAFLAALQQDIDDLPLTEKYFPENAARAVVNLPRLLRRSDTGALEYDYSTLRYNGNEIIYSYFTGTDNSKQLDFSGPFTSTIRVYLTDSYTCTLAFLRETGVCGFIDESAPDTSSITEIIATRWHVNPNYQTHAPYFRAYTSGVYTARGNTLSIDPSEYANLLRLARTHYYASEGGYLLAVKVRDTDSGTRTVTLFVPEQDAPDYLKGL